MSSEDWVERKTNLIKCPYCNSYAVARIVIPWEGEKLICGCGKEELILAENITKKNRRGVRFG